MMDIAKRMVEYRAKERISQTELAKRAGISLQTVCAIETGQQTPSRVTVAKIELALKEGNK